MSAKDRILVVSHAHPDFSLGGGEIAAHRLFTAYKNNPAVEDAWFVARADRGRGASGMITLRRPNEYLWEQGVDDWHSLKAVNRFSLNTWFADLIRAVRPTIVHTHHYAHLGLEYLRVIKEVDPNIRIFMTLHEFIAICRNNGQMIKTGSFALCSSATFDECHRCFPESSSEDFWLRKHRFLNYFGFVDGFIAPSEFLRQRYIQWGLKPEQITVIENGQLDDAPIPPRPLHKREGRNRFGFFGQINPYKGLDVVLEAVSQLEEDERQQIRLEVHGANLEIQTADFREKIAALRGPLVKEGVLHWVGPYQPRELRGRLADIDWVLVPSIWWENSPMVIQEAFAAGRPVVCSDIGGMAEKVRHNIDGLHAKTGNRLHWGHTLLEAVRDATLWPRLAAGIQKPISPVQCAESHLEQFSLLRGGRIPAAAKASAVATAV